MTRPDGEGGRPGQLASAAAEPGGSFTGRGAPSAQTVATGPHTAGGRIVERPLFDVVLPWPAAEFAEILLAVDGALRRLGYDATFQTDADVPRITVRRPARPGEGTGPEAAELGVLARCRQPVPDDGAGYSGPAGSG